MNRRTRRRAARNRPRQAVRTRRPLAPLPRIALLLLGIGLIVASILLGSHGTSARGGRLIGAVALCGIIAIAVAWYGRF